jgi:hypothetical protein
MMSTSLLEELGIAKMIIDIVASEFHVNGPGVGVLALSSQLDNSVAPLLCTEGLRQLFSGIARPDLQLLSPENQRNQPL